MKQPSRAAKHTVKLYAATGTRSIDELDPNSSCAKVYGLIEPGSRVLDVGCGSGELASYLAARGDKVWGTDLNPAALEQAAAHCVATALADLEVMDIEEIFPGLRFDVVVFADVLEHLREPWRALQGARNVLDTGGTVAASIPNFAHAAVRLAVLSGAMPYRTLGILDDTHLRFFTLSGVDALFEDSGFRLRAIDRTILAFGAPTDLVPDVSLLRVPEDIVRHIRDDPESDTLQFVVCAVPIAGSWDMEALRHRLHDVEARAAEQAVGMRNMERELSALRAALASAEESLAKARDAAAEELTATLARTRESLTALESDQNNALASAASSISAFEDARRRIEALEQDASRIDAAAREAIADRDALAARTQESEARVLALEEEAASLRKHLEATTKLQSERDAYRKRAESADAGARALTNQLAQVAALLEGFAEPNESAVAAVAALRRRVHRTEVELRDARAELEAIRAEAECDHLVRRILEHELAEKRDEGEDFWPAAATVTPRTKRHQS